jgi:hypothetical protein
VQKLIRAICNRISCSLGRATTALSVFSVGVLLTSTAVSAQSQSCFDQVTLEPSLIAFTTTKHSKLADWYQRILGLEITKEFSFPDGTVTGTLMHKDEFVVEVFNRDDALEGLDYVPAASPEQWRGVLKFGVYSNANLPILKQCLEDQGVKAGRIFNDKKLGIDLLQVVDPEMNVLEIISRINK